MAKNQDARPFVDLQNDADEFQAKFEEDIEKCKSVLHSKITALICNPESLKNSVGPKQNALVEFSKSKYDIYISMKSLMNDMEREWIKYISEMKKLFIDNVELFLANTKLEVKLPSGYQPSSAFEKSPGLNESTTIRHSIYPILSAITKSIPVFSPKNRKSLDFEIVNDEEEKVLPAENGISDDEDADEENPAPPRSRNIFDDNRESNEPEQCILQPLSPENGRKSQLTAKNRKMNGMSSKNVSSAESQDETVELKSDLTRVSSRKSVRSATRLKDAAITKKCSTTSDESEDINKNETNTILPLKGRRGRQAPKGKAKTKTLEPEREDSETACEEKLNVTSVISKTRKGRSTAAKNVKNTAAVESEKEEATSEEKLNKTSKITRRSAHPKTVRKSVMETAGTSVSTNSVTFIEEQDINDDLELYTPVARPSKSLARRKTLLPNLEEDISGADIIPEKRITIRSKRKTIGGVSDLASVTPSKRLKSSNTQSKDEGGRAADNLLEANDSYSEWIPLKSIDGKIPLTPAVYEVKVWRAKKSAHIGFCENLRQKLTLHKLRQNSGHKHLDKFIERNYDDIQIRYEIVSSVNEAKAEVKDRVNSFVALHKTTPAYN